MLLCCGLVAKEKKIVEKKGIKENKDVIALVSDLSDITIRAKAPFRIGTRMGRPEKAAERKMRPPPHVLFPIGNNGSTSG